MRNLKRVLSLSLASVMLLGMMVIGTSAASDYTDVDYVNDNVEAIEVLQAINVMTGDLDSNGNLAGTFRPGDEVSRAEMARIMAALMDLDYDYYIGANPFSDMVGHWAEGFAAACYANGIIAGRTNTTYDPSATVTAVEASAMLMRALGYFQNKEVDYADGFEISTIRQAGKINLFNKVDVKTNEPMTRNDVAQLILNTLQSGMVEPSNNNKIDVTVGDAQVTIGSSNYVYTVARDNAVGRAINATSATAGNSSTGLEGLILDLGEKLYNGELRLNSDAQDVFGRPARVWEFYGQTIGTYYKDELILEEYVTGVSGKTLYELLGSSIVDGSNSYDFRIYMDGLDHEANSAVFEKVDINRNNNANLGATGRGVLTQVFVDNSKENVYDRGEVTITMINTYLAVANADYNETRDRASFDVYYLTKDTNKDLFRSTSFKNATDNKDIVTLNVASEDISIAADVEKDEVYLVTVAKGEIQSLIPAPAIEETAIQAFDVGDYIETDSGKYNFAKTTLFDIATLRDYTGKSAETNLKENRYNVYLDAYGNLIGVEVIDPTKNYVFITGVDASYSFLSTTNYKVNGIFLDGTMATMNIDSKKSQAFTNYINGPIVLANEQAVVNTWCTYTVNSAGVYTLKLVAAAPGVGGSVTNRAQYHDDVTALIDYRNYSLIGDVANSDYRRVYSDDETVFLTVSIKDVLTQDLDDDEFRDILIDDVDGVAVGIDNVDIEVYNTTALAVQHAEDHDTHIDTFTDHRNYSYGSYVLYNEDGYVIAAVVVGDDGGVGSDFVYVYDGNIEERDLGGDDWQWSRDAIVNGELTTLIEVNDSGVSYLSDMQAYRWYRVTYKADGTVGKVTSFTPTDTSSDSWSGYYGVAGNITTWAGKLPSGTAATVDVRNIEDLVKETVGIGNVGLGRDTVVYHQYITNAKPYVTTNGTLHVFGTAAYNTTDGIRIAKDAKVWFRQYVNSKEIWDNGIGPDYVEDIIKELKPTSSGGYNYDIAAVIEDARATTVIIYDRENDYTRPSVDTDIIGIPMDGSAYVEDINAELAAGNDVTITTPWQGLTGNGTYQLQLKGGTTLKFLDDLDLTTGGVLGGEGLDPDGHTYSIRAYADGTEKANLIVNGRFVMSPQISQTIRYNVTAEAMTIWRDEYSTTDRVSVNIASTVRVTENGGGSNWTADFVIGNYTDVDVLDGAYLYLGNATKNSTTTYDGGNPDPDMGTLSVHGHAEVNGELGIDSTVFSSSTLVVSEPVTTSTITIGNIGTTVGRFEGTIGSGGSYKVDFDATVGSNPVVTMPTLRTGSLLVLSKGDKVSVDNVPAGVVLVVGGDAQLIVTGKIETQDIVVAPGAKLTMAAGAVVSGQATNVIRTPDGGSINGNVGTTELTIENTGNTVKTTSAAAKSKADNAATTDAMKGELAGNDTETPSVDEVGKLETDKDPVGSSGAIAPVTVSAKIVYNKTTWNEAVSEGYVPVRRNSQGAVPKWDEWVADHDATVKWDSNNGPKTFPWLLVKVTNNLELDVEANSKYNVKVEKGSNTVFTAADWAEDSIPTAAGRSITMHWDMYSDRHNSVVSGEGGNTPAAHNYYLTQESGEEATGSSYKITVTWGDSAGTASTTVDAIAFSTIEAELEALEAELNPTVASNIEQP